MPHTRRDFGKLALAALPLVRACAAVNSKIQGVQIGAITYCFRDFKNPRDIIPTMVDIGLGEVELMSGDCEKLAGLPAKPSFPSGKKTPEQQEQTRQAQAAQDTWRANATADTWKPVRKQFNDAGIDVALLCYNMNDKMKDVDIEYGFRMAEALGVKAISTSTTLTMAKRIAPVADSHKLRVGYHGHDKTSDPNETATLESYDTLMAYGKYTGVNLDIGHFTSANYDAVAFIKEHHAKITNLHLKDKKRDHGDNTLWGQGDTPIKPVLQLLKKEKYGFPANIELEYKIPEGSTVAAEMKKCLAYCREALA